LSSSATSPVVVRGSASMILSVGHCQLPMAQELLTNLCPVMVLEVLPRR